MDTLPAIAILGAGSMGGAILNGLVQPGTAVSGPVRVTNRTEAKAAAAALGCRDQLLHRSRAERESRRHHRRTNRRGRGQARHGARPAAGDRRRAGAGCRRHQRRGGRHHRHHSVSAAPVGRGAEGHAQHPGTRRPRGDRPGGGRSRRAPPTSPWRTRCSRRWAPCSRCRRPRSTRSAPSRARVPPTCSTSSSSSPRLPSGSGFTPEQACAHGRGHVPRRIRAARRLRRDHRGNCAGGSPARKGTTERAIAEMEKAELASMFDRATASAIARAKEIAAGA